MSTRVNLLLADELRQHSSVSRESLVRFGGIGAGLVAVAILGWMVWRYLDTGRLHRVATAEWAAIEADYEKAKAVQDELNVNRRYLDELEAWSDARARWFDPLSELRAIVPDNMQLQFWLLIWKPPFIRLCDRLPSLAIGMTNFQPA